MSILSVMAIFHRLFSLLCAITLLTLVPRIAAADPANFVILISVDGAPAYHLRNEELLLPNMRDLIRNGVWSEGSQTVFPSMTLPSHTTLITGVSPRVHGTLGNRVKNRKTGEVINVDRLPRAQSIHTTTLFDAAKRHGISIATFRWPQTKGDPSIDFNILLGAPTDEERKDPAWVFLQQQGFPIDMYASWEKDIALRGAKDVLLAEAAAHLIRKNPHRLTAFRVVAQDSVQHAFGTGHYMSKAAVTSTDAAIGVLRKAVRDAGIEDRTTFIVAADHGFTSVTHSINIHPLVKQHGLQDRIKLYESGGWITYVELQPDFDAKRDGASLNAFFAAAQALQGIERVVKPEGFHDLGLPRYEEDEHILGQYMIISDVDTHFRRDLDSSGSTARELMKEPYHGHGYLPTHPLMRPWLVLSGYGIAKGKKIGHVRNHDVAPTIANLLGFQMKDVEGRVLQEALQAPPQ